MKTFIIDVPELKQLEKWQKKHDLFCPVPRTTAIGGRFTYSFIPTSIGVVQKVKCVCGMEKDLTDYKSW